MGDTADKNEYQSDVEQKMEAPVIPIKKQQTVARTSMSDVELLKAKAQAEAQAAIAKQNAEASKPENSYREMYKKMYGEYPKQ
jgi:hypothetical protein